MMKRFVVWFALLALAGSVAAQPSEEQRAKWRAMREAGDSSGPRPPDNATPEERRAFWQKKAAERRQEEERPAADRHADHAPAPATAGVDKAADKVADKTPAATPATAPKGKDDSSRAEAAAVPGRPAGMAGMTMRGGTLWLADTPPMRGDGGRPGGMGGMSMGGGERSGPPTKRLWLRSGNDPQKSGFAREDAESPLEYLLVTPAQPEGAPLPAATEARKGLVFETPVQGFYRLYATTRKVQGETLAVTVARAEIPYFSHGGDEEERASALKASRYLDSAPLEIVRERAADEKPFFQLRSGDEQGFLVLQKGLPVPGARVRFISHQGWSKEAVSDEQGRVAFQIIRDYFPPWDDFQKRYKATYLLIADVMTPESGKWKDQPYSNVRYQATLAGSYYPASNDYRSYAWGLGIGLLVTVLCALAVWAYRRRHSKPYQEVRFDETK